MALQTKCKVDAGQEVLVSHKTLTQLTPTRLIKMVSFCFTSTISPVSPPARGSVFPVRLHFLLFLV